MEVFYRPILLGNHQTCDHISGRGLHIYIISHPFVSANFLFQYLPVGLGAPKPTYPHEYRVQTYTSPCYESRKMHVARVQGPVLQSMHALLTSLINANVAADE